MTMRRLATTTNVSSHDVVIDVLTVAGGVVPIPATLPPPNCGSGSFSTVARARYDASLLPYTATGSDVTATIHFVTSAGVQLDPSVTYALYYHIDAPGIDRLGLAGTESDSYANFDPYTRQMRVQGPSCMSNPAWTKVSGRDVNFFLTLDDGCTTGATVSCGLGVCARTVNGCDAYGNIQTCQPGSCTVNADCTGGGSTCNPATHVCTTVGETCNNKDDDCNGTTDDNVPPITCGTGLCASTGTCNLVTHTMNPCTPNAAAATSEACNNVDDNCNGITDDSSALGQTTCGLAGSQCQHTVLNCVSGHPNSCVPIASSAEVCNGLDDDCDGFNDNTGFGVPGGTLTQKFYTGSAATRNVGQCKDGQQNCSATAGSGVAAWTTTSAPVLPSAELCNGLDDDCDGFVDNAVTGNAAKLTQGYWDLAAGLRNKGQCRDGVQTCSAVTPGVWSVTANEVGPSAETCDGVDNDCNGVTDDGAGATTCGLGRCSFAVASCVNGQPFDPRTGVGVCTPVGAPASQQGNQALKQAESCNDIDDDCDGFTDNAPGVNQANTLSTACHPLLTAFGGSAGANRGRCHDGSITCTAGVNGSCTGEVGPVTDTCNGIDDDCDGSTDNNPIATLCPTPSGAAGATCGGTAGCSLTGCQASFYNFDGQYANGCECQEDANGRAGTSNTANSGVNTGPLTNQTCPVAGAPANWANLGSVSQGGSTSVTANVPVSNLADYYQITFPHGGSDPAPGTVSISFASNPNNDFRMQVFSNNSCGGAWGSCAAGTPAAPAFLTSFTYFETTSNSTTPGAGAGSTDNGTTPWPTTVWVKVTRIGGGGNNCENYTLQVSR